LNERCAQAPRHLDLYLTGHGLPITRELIAWEPDGVHMSAGASV
jgi:hypothetical protein